MTDFEVQDQGSIFIVVPLTDDARAWLRENVDPGAMQWGGGIVVEHRYIDPLVDGIKDAGFSVG